ncbi:hypothetical protein CAPTEDRAFT_207778 [Capitella teleta]|uniref:Calponin-homology (CH) domain-containing protein n=1 Tax=Capitella teleta TaxID=283909 RepID=R7U363_CAPTE|nr:hypothetical protein CAPTEDRAFT_207778 [Capitella teleta]|eukprot:ELT98116.1 hypothetical protein CAPTEDRAFT_207778 [Capitella teleta]
MGDIEQGFEYQQEKVAKIAMHSAARVNFLLQCTHSSDLGQCTKAESTLLSMDLGLGLLPAGTASKRGLLEWVQSHIPNLRVVNLSTSWSDGVALCALVEALCPGSCPRYDLLKPGHKVNNCRLGLKLAFKYLGVPQNIASAEDIALANSHREKKVMRLLSLMKWASTQRQKLTAKTIGGEDSSPAKGKINPCTARGSGLIVGLTNKRSKFDLHTPPNELLDIHIIITGPKAERCDEKIISLFPTKNNTPATPTEPTESKAASRWHESTARLLGTENMQQIIHRRHSAVNVAEISDALKVPFDYKCICEGSILVSYIPRNEGIYTIDIKWHETHIKGSPFQVTVSDTIDKLNKCNKGHMRQSELSQAPRPSQGKLPEVVLPDINVPPPLSPTPPPPEGGEDEEDEDVHTGITAAVLNRTSKVQRSISHKGLSNKMAKQATVTRRRVLKRVITSGGQEIVIQMAPPTPSGSQDSGDRVPAAALDSPPITQHKQRKKRKENDRSFDFEIWYDSDTSYASSNNSRCVTPTGKSDRSMPSKMLYFYTHEILEALLQDVFRIAECRKRENMLKTKDLHRVSTEESSNLGLPTFDIRFQCSPFTSGQEALKLKQSDSEDSDRAGHSIAVDPLVQRGLALLHERIQAEKSSHENLSSKVKPKLSAAVSMEMFTSNGSLQKEYSKYLASDTESSMTSLLETDSDSVKKSSPNTPPKTLELKKSPCHEPTKSIKRNENKRLKSKTQNATETKKRAEVKNNDIQIVKMTPTQNEKKVESSTTENNMSLPSCVDDENLTYALEAHLADHSTSVNPHLGLRMSTSLPTLNKLWTAFEIEEECELSIREMEALSVAAQQKQKRATLGPGDLKEILHEFNSQYREPETHSEMVSRNTATRKEVKAEAAKSMLLIESHTPKFLSPRVSPLSTPGNSQVSCGRYNPSNGCRTGEEKGVVQMGVWEARPGAVTHETLSSSGRPLPALHRDSPKGRVGIKVPKATIDRKTQVAYEEIKRETGWKKPSQYVRPRPQIVRSHRISVSSLSESIEDNSIGKENRPKLPKIVCDLDPSSQVKDAVSHSSTNLLSPQFLSVDCLTQSQRQSTVDTIDSGIVEDNSSKPASPSFFKACALALRPKFINGHRAVSRNSYRGKMTLDPRLISATTPTTPTPPSEEDGRKGWPFLSRLKRKGEEMDGGQRRRASFRSGGCYKRRVTFSRRVMLHRRSSSRSSKKDSSSQEQELGSTANDHRMASASADSTSIESELKILQFKPMRVEQQPSRASSGIVSDMTGTPTDHEDKKQSSSVESFDGFGVSCTGRLKLLDELATFSQLTTTNKASESASPSNVDSNHKSLTDCSIRSSCDVFDSDCSDEVAQLTRANEHQGSVWKVPSSNKDSALEMPAELLNPPANFKGEEPTMPTLKDFDFDAILGSDLSDTADLDENHELALPDPFRCKAMGSGLRVGKVHAKNNFQIVTKTAGNGCLNVSITGPRPRTVQETQVVYTGDDLYEVLFEVTQPGYYVISVKWSDYNIPESPFICNVSY